MPRAKSRVPPGLFSVLSKVSSRIPVAVVTSKDYRFIRRRTGFAWAWACVAGLEIILSNEFVYTPSRRPRIERSLETIQRILPEGILLERKLAADGWLLGFSVDWTAGPRITEARIRDLVELLQSDGLRVFRYPSQSYLDAYSLQPDKGTAILRLAGVFGAETGVAYIGDSPLDNPAFQRSDISIGVDHGQPMDQLACEYVVDASLLRSLLESLLASDLAFSARKLPLSRR